MRGQLRHDHKVRPHGKETGATLNKHRFIPEFLPIVSLDGFVEGFLSEHSPREKLTWVDDLHRLNREGLAAAAAFYGVGVVERKTFSLKSVLVIQFGTFEIGSALGIDKKLDPFDIFGFVARLHGIKSEDIGKSRASAGAYADAQTQFRLIFFR